MCPLDVRGNRGTVLRQQKHGLYNKYLYIMNVTMAQTATLHVKLNPVTDAKLKRLAADRQTSKG